MGAETRPLDLATWGSLGTWTRAARVEGWGGGASPLLCRQIELSVASSKKSSWTHPCKNAVFLLWKAGPPCKQPCVRLAMGVGRGVDMTNCTAFRKGPSPGRHRCMPGFKS